MSRDLKNRSQKTNYEASLAALLFYVEEHRRGL